MSYSGVLKLACNISQWSSQISWQILGS